MVTIPSPEEDTDNVLNPRVQEYINIVVLV